MIMSKHSQSQTDWRFGTSTGELCISTENSVNVSCTQELSHKLALQCIQLAGLVPEQDELVLRRLDNLRSMPHLP